MEITKSNVVVFILALVILAVATSVKSDENTKTLVKYKHGKKYCDKGWECKGWSIYCCNLTISDYFQTYQFENLFSKRNTPVAKAVGFWDYHSFITAAAVYEPLGFGTTGNKTSQMMEIAAFLGHVGCKTSCGFGVATGGPLAWGLCYNHEMSPSQSYCDDYYKFTYPCTPGAEYYGRGALPIYWLIDLYYDSYLSTTTTSKAPQRSMSKMSRSFKEMQRGKSLMLPFLISGRLMIVEYERSISMNIKQKYVWVTLLTFFSIIIVSFPYHILGPLL